MDNDQYLQHCRATFSTFADTFVSRTESLAEGDSLRDLALAFKALSDGEGDIYSSAPTLVDRLFTTYPDFSPTFPRELLWFLGGDCLHFMPDEEIQVFQQLEEMRGEAAHRGEVIDFASARETLLKRK